MIGTLVNVLDPIAIFLLDATVKTTLCYVQVFDKGKARAISKSYGVWGIPSAFLVNQNGVINAPNLRGDRVETAVKALLTNGPINIEYRLTP